MGVAAAGERAREIRRSPERLGSPFWERGAHLERKVGTKNKDQRPKKAKRVWKHPGESDSG